MPFVYIIVVSISKKLSKLIIPRQSDRQKTAELNCQREMQMLLLNIQDFLIKGSSGFPIEKTTNPIFLRASASRIFLPSKINAGLTISS